MKIVILAVIAAFACVACSAPQTANPTTPSVSNAETSVAETMTRMHAACVVKHPKESCEAFKNGEAQPAAVSATGSALAAESARYEGPCRFGGQRMVCRCVREPYSRCDCEYVSC